MMKSAAEVLQRAVNTFISVVQLDILTQGSMGNCVCSFLYLSGGSISIKLHQKQNQMKDYVLLKTWFKPRLLIFSFSWTVCPLLCQDLTQRLVWQIWMMKQILTHQMARGNCQTRCAHKICSQLRRVKLYVPFYRSQFSFVRFPLSLLFHFPHRLWSNFKLLSWWH